MPGLARARQEGGQLAAWRLASLMLSALAMVLAVVVLLGLFLAPQLLRWIAPGFQADPKQLDLALRLTRLLFPFIGFMGFAALFMGMLNERRQFTAPALAPAAMNVVMISFGLFICPRLGSALDVQVTGWAVGALVGGAAQWLVQIPAALRAGFRWQPAWPWRDPGVRRILGQMGPAVLGLSTTQVNLVVNTMLASQLAVGTVTCLTYGNRLMQLPLGVFGVAIATAVLPDLAAYHAGGDARRFKETLSYGLRLTLLITLPCLVGLVMLALPINVLLLKGGNFDLAAAQLTASLSIAYTLGVVFASWIKVLVPAFYALDAASLPVKVSVAMVLVNLALNLALWRHFGAVGLALTSTLVALAQVLCLLFFMRQKVGHFIKSQDLGEAARVLLAGAGLGLGLWLARQALDARFSGWETGANGKGQLFLLVLGLIIGGVLLYGALAIALKLDSLVPERFWPRKARASAVEAEVAKAQADAYDEG